MIKEDYVSFDTAKLLKEKWFKFIEDKDELSKAYIHAYTKEGKEVWGCYSPDYYPCITMNMAMKWLREVHNLYIELNWEKGNQLYSFQIWKLEKFQPEISSLDLWRIYKDDNYLGEWIYEQACETAIKYCLENLI